MSRMTKVTAVDIDSGETESVEIGPKSYVVICGGDRYIAHKQTDANGTTIVTIKTHDGDFR